MQTFEDFWIHLHNAPMVSRIVRLGIYYSDSQAFALSLANRRASNSPRFTRCHIV